MTYMPYLNLPANKLHTSPFLQPHSVATSSPPAHPTPITSPPTPTPPTPPPLAPTQSTTPPNPSYPTTPAVKSTDQMTTGRSAFGNVVM